MRRAAALAAVPERDTGAVTTAAHWARLLDTMPGVREDRLWHARLGEFEKFEGPSCDKPQSRGAILHLYKAADPSPAPAAAAAADEPRQGQGLQNGAQPAAVRVSYFTANAAPGAASGAEPRLRPPQGGAGAPAPAPGGGAAMDVLLPLLWDQNRMGAEASRPFVFSPDSPVLKLDIGEQPPADGGAPGAPSPPPLFASPRLLPLGGGSLAIVAPALPGAGAWGEALAGAMPVGSFWFLEIVLAHHDAAGEPLLSTLSVSYSWRDGKLLGHRYYWQKSTGLVRQPEGDNLDAIAIRSVMAPAPRGDDDSVNTLLHRALGRPPADRRAARYSYAAAPPHPLTLAEGAAPAPGPALDGVTATAGSAAESATDERGVAESVYGGGEACVRLPADLRAAAEAAAAGPRAEAGPEGRQQVAFDFFAADGPGGLVRCTVTYDAAAGSQQAFVGEGALPLLYVQHEVY